jgi:hypothetical protein
MSRWGQEVEDPGPEYRVARQWLGLAIGVLVLAGLFALAVVVGRMPPFDRFVTDPLFFKRCLVAHVNLALIAWFYSFVAALLFLLPSRRPVGRLARYSPHLGLAGVGLILLGAGVPDARPLLSNYIPTIDHPLFRAGQLLFAAAVVASVVDRRLLPARASGAEPPARFCELPAAVEAGLRAVAVALGLAVLTFVVSWWNQPSGVAAEVYYDLLAWGGGHVLQLVSAIAMVSVWLLLLGSLLGESPVSRRATSALLTALVLPWLVAPLLPLAGSWSPAYREGFTRLMQWGLFPVITIFLWLCVAALGRAWREGQIDRRSLADPRVSAFLVSAGLTLLGFALGAAIRGSNTMVPAHYHASVGGVTVAFMAGVYLLLPVFGLSVPTAWLRRVAGWQPSLYGAGMLVFASGFALAGAYGMGRKVYGAEQAARGVAESIGLGLMGIGGFVAVAGGVMFLAVVGAAWWRGASTDRTRSELATSPWRWRYGPQGTR